MTFIVSEDQLRCLADNNLCADCNVGSPTHCDVEHGVLICAGCGLVHKDINGGTFEVRILDDDQLSQEDILRLLERGGNRQVNDELERYLPSSYKKGLAQLNTFVRSQYIIKKYVKREFATEDDTNMFRESRRVGMLSKRSELSENEWNLQCVVLDSEKQVLECLAVGGAFQPENVIPLASAELFIESLRGHEECEYCIRVSWKEEKLGGKKSAPMNKSDRRKDRVIKQIFLTSRREEEIFEWYCCILATQGTVSRAKQLVQIRVPQSMKLTKSKSTPMLACKPILNTTVDVSAVPQFLKTGKLWKAGPERMDSWRERWFTLHDTHLVYSRNKLASHASGDLFIGATVDGYRVEKGYAKHSRNPPNEFTFTLITPWRSYYLCAESTEEREEWIAQINRVIHYNNSTLVLRARMEFGLGKSNSVKNANSV